MPKYLRPRLWVKPVHGVMLVTTGPERCVRAPQAARTRATGIGARHPFGCSWTARSTVRSRGRRRAGRLLGGRHLWRRDRGGNRIRQSAGSSPAQHPADNDDSPPVGDAVPASRGRRVGRRGLAVVAGVGCQLSPCQRRAQPDLTQSAEHGSSAQRRQRRRAILASCRVLCPIVRTFGPPPFRPACRHCNAYQTGVVVDIRETLEGPSGQVRGHRSRQGRGVRRGHASSVPPVGPRRQPASTAIRDREDGSIHGGIRVEKFWLTGVRARGPPCAHGVSST